MSGVPRRKFKRTFLLNGPPLSFSFLFICVLLESISAFTYQMVEVAVSGKLFAEILLWIHRLHQGSTMLEQEKDKLFKNLNELGVDQVRERLAMKSFGNWKVPLVELWLKRQEEKLPSKNIDDEGKRMTSITQPKWNEIEIEFKISKGQFGKRINFVKDKFKRNVIFRDIMQAHALAAKGYYKPAVILSGGVIEEILRLYLIDKSGSAPGATLQKYIETCLNRGFLKSGANQLADSVREFRNLVHLQREATKKQSISSSIAKGAVASIFTIVDSLE